MGNIGATQAQFAEARAGAELLPVRMLNESVYCPRLFYLMHVMGEWAPSVDTVEGKNMHSRVDRREEPFPEVDQRDPDDPRARARSVLLSSERLGIIARMDLVEHAGNEATPVDYKHGKPPRTPERAWLPERVQLCAQGLILEEHGWCCEAGVLYFPQTREKVEIPLDQPMRKATLEAIETARQIEKLTEMPPPLVDSPKCPRCSLAGICLPDETNMLIVDGSDGAEIDSGRPRRLVPAADDALPLHLGEQGSRVGVTSRRLVVRDRSGQTTTVLLKDISQ